MQASQREIDMFNLLCAETVHQVSGGFGHTFWAVDLLRATQVYPAIWHACLALAAMHERIKISEKTESTAWIARNALYDFSLCQYNVSIKYVIGIGHQNALTYGDKETLLLASILFNALCCLQGDIRQATLHAWNGLQLFYQWLSRDQTDELGICHGRNGIVTASSLFMLMSFTESQFMNRVTNIASPLLRRYIIPYKCSKPAFTSVTDAYFEFQHLFTGLLSVTQFSHSPSYTAQHSPRADNRHAYRLELDVWKTKFQNLEQQSYNFQQVDTEKLLLMHILFTGVEVCLYVDLRNAEVDYDRYQSKFEHIVNLAEQLLTRQSRNNNTIQNHAGPLFSFSLSLCEVLYWVGIRCRDYITRRRVISLLKTWPRRDGIWDSTLIATIVEAVMKLEEAGMLGGDQTRSPCGCIPGVFICSSHRVVGVETEFLGDGVAKVTLNAVGNLRRSTKGHTVFVSL